MENSDRFGKPKVVEECSYPLTATECVDLIVTDLAVILVDTDGLLLLEICAGWTVEEIKLLTEAELKVSPNLKDISL